ncbi:MAG: DUF3298/DUF4163 domain-containing protein [Chitinophagaceae bacterium]|nr:MAG: DUF3298/DUF4163 domain-containing protein [Chitinophagaceae bacterium]
MKFTCMQSIKKYHSHLYCFLISIGLIITGCHSNHKKTSGQQPPEKVVSSYYKYLQGTVGTHKVIIQLIKYQHRYEGVFINDSIGKPLEITGEKDSSGRLTLISYDHYNPVDTLTGAFPQPGVFQGDCYDSAGNHTTFTLQEIYPPGTYQWKVYTLSDSLAYDASRQNSPQARVQMILLWPKGNENLMKDTIIKYYCGRDTALVNPAQVIRSPANSFFAEYKNLKRNLKNSTVGEIAAIFNWESDVDMKILWNADSIVSIAFQSYQYTGGAHGLSNTLLSVFDLKENRSLTPSDIFKQGYEQELRQALEQELREQYDIPDGAPLNGDHGILFDKQLALTKNFYLTGKGIGFIYNLYEVAPYAVGQINLYIPFSKIANVIQPAYLNMED